MTSPFFRKYNTLVFSFAAEWHAMFREIEELKSTLDWINNMITLYTIDTNEIFTILKVNLDKCYDLIHSEDPSVFDRDDVILFHRFQLKQIFPRLSKREKTILFNKLKGIVEQNGIVNVIGGKTRELDNIMQTLKSSGRTNEELKQTLGKEFLVNGALRGQMLDLLFGALEEEKEVDTEKKVGEAEAETKAEPQQKNDLMDTISSLGPMLRALGIVSSKTTKEGDENPNMEATKETDGEGNENKDTCEQNEDKEDNEPTVNEGSEGTKSEQVNQQENKEGTDRQPTASMLYLSRKKRLAKLRRQQKPKKETQKNQLLSSVADILENMKEMKDSPDFGDKKTIRKEMEQMFKSTEMQDLFTKFSGNVTSMSDLPCALESMITHLGAHGNEEMKAQLDEMKGMKLEDMQQMCMDQIRNLPKHTH